MNILRNIIVSLCISTVALIIPVFLFASAINNTVLDKERVKSWFTSENIYNDNFIKTLFMSEVTDTDKKLQKQPATLQLSQKELATAFSTAFSPAFIRSQVENIIDSTHDMASGKNKELRLTISLNQKKATLIKQLTILLEPKVAKLPVCTTADSMPNLAKSDKITCRPPTVTASSLAKQIANRAITTIPAYNKPIELVNTIKRPEQKLAAQRLPVFYSVIKWTVIVFPIIAALLVGIAILLTKHDYRLRITGRIARRTLVTTALTFIIALILIWLGGNLNINGNMAIYLIPLLETIVRAFGIWLAIISGLVSLLCIVVLIVLRIINKQRETALTPPTAPMPPSVPPLA